MGAPFGTVIVPFMYCLVFCRDVAGLHPTHTFGGVCPTKVYMSKSILYFSYTVYVAHISFIFWILDTDHSNISTAVHINLSFSCVNSPGGHIYRLYFDTVLFGLLIWIHPTVPDFLSFFK